MKRVLTLIGTILGGLVDAAYCVFMLLGITVLLSLFGNSDGGAVLAVIGILEIAIGLVALILNLVCTSAFACDNDRYTKKLALIISAIVFNVLLGAFLIFGLTSNLSVIFLIICIVSFVVPIFYIIDLCLEKRRVEKANTITQVEDQQ